MVEAMDDGVPRLTKHMISKVGEPIGFILYQRDDDGGTKYKIQRTLAGGVRVKEWYTPEQMEEGVLNLLLPRFVQRAYENEAARVAEEQSQDEKDCFAEGWLIPACDSDFDVVTDLRRLKVAPRHEGSMQSLQASAYVLDLSDCTEVTQAQTRGELCLKALIDGMPRKPLKWGSSKCNFDALHPRQDGEITGVTVERMWNRELAPVVHPLYR